MSMVFDLRAAKAYAGGILATAAPPVSNFIVGLVEAATGWDIPVSLENMLLTGVAFASLAIAASVPALFAMVAVWTLGEMTQRPVSTAAVADRAPVHARGRYQAAEDASLGASLLIGPLVGTALYGWSPAVLWTACGVVGALAGLAALRSGRHPVPVGTWDRPGGRGSAG